MTITRKQFLLGLASTPLLLDACSDDEGDGRATLTTLTTLTTLEGAGDGDGDNDTTGDGDGDTGDGDGDIGDGDGDSGDGDGDAGDGDGDTGDGDGDTGDGDGDTGDGDGDGDTGDGDGDGDVEQACPQGASGTILANHGHTLLIPQADILAGVPKQYNIQGGANHGHTVTLSAGDFAQLALGNPVQQESSFLQAHTHTVIMACLL